MFDRRSGRRARDVRGQSREALAATRRARLGRSREKKRARAVFFVERFFVERNALSSVRFGFLENAGVRTASARARRGDAPIGSSGPADSADSARAPAAPQTRTSRTTPRESASRGRPWRSVRPSESICRAQKIPGKPRGRDVGTFGSPRADPPTREGAATGRAHVRTPPNAIAFEVGVGSGKKVVRRAARSAPRVARR